MEISRIQMVSFLAPMEVSYHVARTAGKRTARKHKPFAQKIKVSELFIKYKINTVYLLIII